MLTQIFFQLIESLMEYLNVTQFYETVIFITLPLLLFKQMILCCCGISEKYQSFRRSYYESQFKFTMQYQFVEPADIGTPKELSLKDQMLERQQDSFGQTSSNPSMQVKKSGPHNNEQSAIMRTDLQADKQFKRNTRPASISNRRQANQQVLDARESEQTPSKPEKNDFRLNQMNYHEEEVKSSKSDKSQKNENSVKSGKLSRDQEPEQNMASSPDRKKGKFSRNSAELSAVDVEQSIAQKQDQQKPARSAENIEKRHEYEFDKSITLKEGENDKDEKQQIGQTPEQIQQKITLERRRIKYCRRIDQAFNIYIPMIFSMIVLGILTQSVYILSMCCFFGFAFTSLLFNYSHLLDRLQGTLDKESIFTKVNQLISSIFVLGLFVSYWSDNQFGN